jgi:hypothetical protein
MVAVAGLVLGAILSCTAYMYHYFFRYPEVSAPAWQFGLKEAYEEAEKLDPKHDSIYVTRAMDFPFIHRLYLFGFPPEEYQQHGFSRTKYLFDEPVFYAGGLVAGRERPLFLLAPGEVPERSLTVGRTIRNPDGSPAFVLAW